MDFDDRFVDEFHNGQRVKGKREKGEKSIETRGKKKSKPPLYASSLYAFRTNKKAPPKRGFFRNALGN
jgi:hypothetical protein